MTPNAILFDALSASKISTPIGIMAAICDNEGLLRLQWQQDEFDLPYQDSDVSRETMRQMRSYLSASLTDFTIPISSKAVSPTLRRWLDTISSVPYGSTASYQELAGLWGNRKAARAAGSACQKNPLPIIVPCHRIIGANGAYDKYSGGDVHAPTSPANVARKKALLQLEAGLSTIL